MTGADVIPVIDLNGLTTGDPAAVATVAAELHAALTQVGFFIVINHGVSWDQVEGVYAQARDLHALPEESKARFPMGKLTGGYLGVGGGTSHASEIAGEVRKPNMNAAFFAHRGGYHESNQWPPIEGFSEEIEAYMDAVIALGHRLLPAFALSLDLSIDWFSHHFDEPSCALRMSHYPVMDYDENEWGLAPHTDSSFMTVLPTNDKPGLQIRPVGHDWIEPPPIAESFLINSGDILKRWTNHRYQSTAHRVRNASDQDRYAMPFFFGARDDAVITPLPTCVSRDHPPRYEPITYGGYQRWFLNRNYEQVTGEQASAEVAEVAI